MDCLLDDLADIRIARQGQIVPIGQAGRFLILPEGRHDDHPPDRLRRLGRLLKPDIEQFPIDLQGMVVISGDDDPGPGMGCVSATGLRLLPSKATTTGKPVF